MIQTQDINGLLTLIIIIAGIVCIPFIWVILGMPRYKKPAVWTTPRAVSTMLSADVAEEISASLDECEQSIS